MRFDLSFASRMNIASFSSSTRLLLPLSQVICVGDFWQLPPVADRGTTAKFAFEVDGWAATMRTEVDLKQVFRQADPSELHDFP